MNSKKKIAIISPFFFPEPISTGKYNTDLALNLSKKGHEVTVFCFHPLYPDWKIKRSNLTLNKIKIIRGGKFVNFSKKNIIRRLILEISYSFFILRKFHKIKKSDIVIPIFPPSLAFFFLLPFLRKNIKKVGIVHDLQEHYSSNKKGILYKTTSKLINFIEKKCYNHCDKLFFLSKEMKNEANRLYGLQKAEVFIQYPFYNINKIETQELDSIFGYNKKCIVYSGALGEKQNPLMLYEFFNYASIKIPNSTFYFFSTGEYFNKLKVINKNSRIKFYNLVDEKNLYELYKKSDVQILPQKENTSKGSLPSKLPNLLVAGCKILAITDKNSEVENLFKNYNIGKVVTTWDNYLLTEALIELLEQKINKKQQEIIAKKLFSIDRMLLKIVN